MVLIAERMMCAEIAHLMEAIYFGSTKRFLCRRLYISLSGLKRLGRGEIQAGEGVRLLSFLS